MKITQQEFNDLFDDQVWRCSDLLKSKGAEYTGKHPDRLHAFKRAAALQNCSPKKAIAGMLAKHIVSLYDMCCTEGVTYAMELWEEKITDSLNYLFLLNAVVKED